MDMHDAKPQNYVGAFQIWQYKNSNKDNWLHTFNMTSRDKRC